MDPVFQAELHRFGPVEIDLVVFADDREVERFVSKLRQGEKKLIESFAQIAVPYEEKMENVWIEVKFFEPLFSLFFPNCEIALHFLPLDAIMDHLDLGWVDRIMG